MSVPVIYKTNRKDVAPNCKIDVVYTWVDSNDPIFREMYQEYTKIQPSNTRYRSYNEISYSIRLLNKFCRFYNNIYIVTAFGQQPPDFDELKKICNGKLFIVDHTEIFDKTVSVPTFNSCVIETFLHKIPNLTEFFLYLNDDMFFGREVYKSDYISNNKGIIDLQVCYFSTHNPANLKKSMYEAHNLNANLLIQTKYNEFNNERVHHYPVLCSKRAFELAHKYFKREITRHVRHRTRSTENIAFIVLAAFVGLKEGIFVRRKKSSFSKMYITDRVFNNLYKNKPHLFCLNHLNYLNEKELAQYHEIMKKYCEEN